VCVVNALGLTPDAQAARPGYVKQLIEESFQEGGRDATDVSVEANGTVVTLRGHVRAWAERSQAEQSAWSAPGVKSVRNELMVQLEAVD
jgi:osmotically-inducible protein OsmY